MRRYIFAITLLLSALVAVGQPRIQQVVVKTKGRLMDNGSVKPGTRLGNVVVSIENGNTWASNGQGEFAFAVGADNAYVISAVKKDGYALADPDIIGRRLGYSASPLFLILEIPAEKMRQQLDIELKVRAILMDRIKAKEEEIERQKNTFAITEKDYETRIKALYDEQEHHPQLIRTMAEEYVNIDFDQADDFERKFAYFLLNGELEKADSLLATRGKIEDDFAALTKQRAENEAMRGVLGASEAHAKLKSEELAKYCLSKYSLHVRRNQPDSAIYYIEKRAECDTTNIKWQSEAASIIYHKFSNRTKAKALYERALRQAERQYGARDTCTHRLRAELHLLSQEK